MRTFYIFRAVKGEYNKMERMADKTISTHEYLNEKNNIN